MDFESRMEQKLDTLIESHGNLRVDVAGVSTKMDKLVGPDGNNGTIGTHEERLARIEGRQTFLAGGFGVAGVGIGAFFHWVAKRFLGIG